MLVSVSPGGSIMRKSHKTYFGREGVVNINKLLTKINIIINCKKVNKEKYSDMQACVWRIWPGWENPELLHWFWTEGGVGAENVPGRENSSLIKRLSWILSFSFSHIQSKDDLFVAKLTWEVVKWKQNLRMTASFQPLVWTTYAFWEAKPFNSCGLVDENQLSILNRQNLSKLRQYLQIIFNHFSNSMKSFGFF